MILKENDVILFQGDSITDCKRNRELPDDLGRGYVWLTSSLLSARFPEYKFKFINRGIGGNRVKDLQARWEQDCLELKPTVLSIYIGINDTWRKYDRNDSTSTEQFVAGYRDILDRARDGLDARLILIEPFVVPVTPDQRQWREDLDPKIQAIRELAMEYNALYVPLDGLFAQVTMRAEPAYWAYDGVHPTGAGHALIADAWLRAVGVI
jgi:lysophospholipase L1-like esterase